MSLNEFRSFTPVTTANLLLGLTLPLGEYDPQNLTNLGANRYAFRLGLPIICPQEQFSGRTTTLEVVPNLHIFTENRETGLQQEPICTLEGHITQDFTAHFWGSFGFLWARGGETRLNGLLQNGSQRSLWLATALNYEFSPRWALNFRYGETVAQNEFGLDGSLYHLKLVTRF
ncbi:transporter [Pseudomonadota bacterium]|jgi:hypothetical protein